MSTIFERKEWYVRMGRRHLWRGGVTTNGKKEKELTRSLAETQGAQRRGKCLRRRKWRVMSGERGDRQRHRPEGRPSIKPAKGARAVIASCRLGGRGPSNRDEHRGAWEWRRTGQARRGGGRVGLGGG